MMRGRCNHLMICTGGPCQYARSPSSIIAMLAGLPGCMGTGQCHLLLLGNCQNLFAIYLATTKLAQMMEFFSSVSLCDVILLHQELTAWNSAHLPETLLRIPAVIASHAALRLGRVHLTFPESEFLRNCL